RLGDGSRPPHAAGPRPPQVLDRAAPHARRRYRLPRGADRPPDRTDQRPDRALQDAREGPSLAARPADADRQAPRVARLLAEERPRAVSGDHREVGHPPLAAETHDRSSVGTKPGARSGRDGCSFTRSPVSGRTTRTTVHMSHTVSVDISGHPLSLETGKVAKQAEGAVVV